MEKGILKNVAINFFGLVLPTFVSLVTVPAYIRTLGVERYGVISLVWTLIGYFGILDLGMSMAAQNHIFRHWKREGIHELAIQSLARIKLAVIVQMAARHRTLRQRPLRAPVAEETARSQRNVFRLVVHILAAGCGAQ